MQGLHLILDCRATKHLSDVEEVTAWVVKTIHACGMRLLGLTALQLETHLDSGPGVSVNATLAESHLCVHTWPELGKVNADFFSCRPFDTDAVYASFMAWFGVTQTMRRHVIERC